MPAIVTLTLNPAIDVSTSTAQVAPERKLRCAPARRDPGGGGINVARVISRLGGEALAIFTAGGFSGERLRDLVRAEGLASLAIPASGETREDFTVMETDGGAQYRFVLPGPAMAQAEWTACCAALAGLTSPPAFLCASGSLPPGAPPDAYAQLADIAAGLGAKFALDTSGAPLKAALAHGVWLVKPNLNEMRDLTGEALADEAAQVAACRRLIAAGGAEVIALTLGAAGAVLVTRDEAWRAAPLAVEAVSTVGAGDSFLGALLWAQAAGKDLEDSFRHAVAGGSAALLAPGTELCMAEDLRGLLNQAAITRIAP